MTFVAENIETLTSFSLIIFGLISYLFLSKNNVKTIHEEKFCSLTLIIILKDLIKNMQQHRGISYSVLNHNRSKISDLVLIETRIEQSSQRLKSLYSANNVADHWLAFQDHWQRLRQNNLFIEAEYNLEQHNRLINVLLFIVEDLMENNHWQDIDNNELAGDAKTLQSLLSTAEWIGQARALGSGILAAGNIESVERIRMNFLKEKLQHCLTTYDFSDECIQPLTEFIELIESAILKSSDESISSSEYFDKATVTIESYMQTFDALINKVKLSMT